MLYVASGRITVDSGRDSPQILVQYIQESVAICDLFAVSLSSQH